MEGRVSRAVRYIRESASRGLQVSDVLSHMGMSRASLQQRMRDRYAVHFSKLGKDEEPDEAEPAEVAAAESWPPRGSPAAEKLEPEPKPKGRPSGHIDTDAADSW